MRAIQYRRGEGKKANATEFVSEKPPGAVDGMRTYALKRIVNPRSRRGKRKKYGYPKKKTICSNL